MNYGSGCSIEPALLALPTTDSDWRWLAGGMGLLVLYLLASAATEMGTRRPIGWRSPKHPSRDAAPSAGDQESSVPPQP
ncbi:hypothetical protein H6G52_10410 [Limnothrix sp. FACHB-881]|uniref:hypothetical protein n=1 Tax=Limnothrix sp. FACHB-881 TaxID=2692819 RepID=UPI001689BDD9|nr:hypothetical protein [Limnothrix sp. FACHB-881]MBD2635771.1 hypothetical protein [Limnothrix sp. FACHB-881]